jgi:hypothetical protein
MRRYPPAQMVLSLPALLQQALIPQAQQAVSLQVAQQPARQSTAAQ